MFRPLHDRVLLRIIDDLNEKTAGGLFIPEKAKDKDGYFIADVVAVGPGKYSTTGALIPMQAKVGDRVILPRFAGWDTKGNEIHVPELPDKKHRICHDEEIFGAIE